MKTSNQWYSIILAVLMVGFMLVLTHWVLALVIGEAKDSKAMENYLKAYAGAEWALELGMMEAKQKNYWVKTSNMAFKSALHTYGGNNKDVSIQYEIDGISRSMSGITLASWDFAIIPLFSHNGKVTQPRFIVNQTPEQMVWNILSTTSGIVWTGNFDKTTNGTQKRLVWWATSLTQISVENFLQNNEQNYLILQNTSNTSLNYSVSSDKVAEYFTLNHVKIIGSAEVAGYKQNIFVDIDVEKYLNLLKYSVFSPH